MKSNRVSTLVILALILAACNCTTYRAVIGVFGEPTSNTTTTYAVSSEIVRWIENSGGVVYVINPFLDTVPLQTELNKVQGIVMYGHKDTEFTYPSKTGPYSSVEYVRQLAATNVQIPLLATGYAFKYLFVDDSIQSNVNFDDSFHSVSFYPKRFSSSRLFSNLSTDTLNSMQGGGSLFFAEGTLVSFNEFMNTQDSKQNYRVTSTINNVNGDQGAYLNTVEDYNNPIYGTQFRPESIGFNRNTLFDNVPDSATAFDVSRAIGNFIVEQAAKVNKQTDFADNDSNLINPNTAIYTQVNGDYYVQFTSPA